MAPIAKSGRVQSKASSRRAAEGHPWLVAYPNGIDWGMSFKPALLSSMFDEAVSAHGPRPCTYFMGRRLTYAEIGALSDRAA